MSFGLNYDDSVIVYNYYENSVTEASYYFGTRFDGVRVELTEAANIRASGIENADSCTVKIKNDGNLPKPYLPPETWNDLTTDEMEKFFTLDKTRNNFFVIVKKQELGIDIELPVGMVDDSDRQYRNGFYQYIREKYGYTYAMHTADVYRVLPRFEVTGA